MCFHLLGEVAEGYPGEHGCLLVNSVQLERGTGRKGDLYEVWEEGMDRAVEPIGPQWRRSIGRKARCSHTVEHEFMGGSVAEVGDRETISRFPRASGFIEML